MLDSVEEHGGYEVVPVPPEDRKRLSVTPGTMFYAQCTKCRDKAGWGLVVGSGVTHEQAAVHGEAHLRAKHPGDAA